MRKFNGGNWTQARYNSFIKSALRAASVRWPPKNEVKKNARVGRGLYICSGYKKESHRVSASVKIGNKRYNNAVVDHCDPIIDPAVGFVSWDSVIERMFCEAEGLQVLCKECHDSKTRDEKEIKKNAKQSV